jgi:hypothetical protein
MTAAIFDGTDKLARQGQRHSLAGLSLDTSSPFSPIFSIFHFQKRQARKDGKLLGSYSSHFEIFSRMLA